VGRFLGEVLLRSAAYHTFIGKSHWWSDLIRWSELIHKPWSSLLTVRIGRGVCRGKFVKLKDGRLKPHKLADVTLREVMPD